jgi:hypothetical protein
MVQDPCAAAQGDRYQNYVFVRRHNAILRRGIRNSFQPSSTLFLQSSLSLLDSMPAAAAAAWISWPARNLFGGRWKLYVREQNGCSGVVFHTSRIRQGRVWLERRHTHVRHTPESPSPPIVAPMTSPPRARHELTCATAAMVVLSQRCTVGCSRIAGGGGLCVGSRQPQHGVGGTVICAHGPGAPAIYAHDFCQVPAPARSYLFESDESSCLSGQALPNAIRDRR